VGSGVSGWVYCRAETCWVGPQPTSKASEKVMVVLMVGIYGRKPVVWVQKPCSHPVQLRGMCGICGADLTTYLPLPIVALLC